YVRLESDAGRMRPEITPAGLQQVAIGSTLNLNLQLRQNGGQYLPTFGLASEPAGMVINGSTGQLTWTPTADQEGLYRVRVSVTTQSGYNTYYLYVLAGNPAVQDLPIVEAPVIDTVAIGETLQVQISSQSLAGRALTHTVYNEPTGVSITADGLLTWTPQADQAGVHTFSVYGADDQYNQSSQNVTITVGHGNYAPEIQNASLPHYVPGQTYTAQINVTDKNQTDTAAYYLDCAPQGASIDNNTGLISWSPAADHASEVTFCVRAFDSSYLSSAKVFYVTVDKPNTPPRIVLETLPTATVGEAFSYQTNVVDPDTGDTIQYSLYYPSEGMSIDANGLFTWTPQADQLGWHQFKIFVKNPYPMDEPDYRYFYVNVVENGTINLPPEFISQPITNVVEGETYQYQAQATDPENDALTYTLSSDLTGLAISSDGFVNWVPASGEVGSHLVTISVQDTSGNTDIQSFTLVIEQANQAPVATNSSINLDEDASLAFVLSASDANGDSLTYAVLSSPTNGALSGAAPNLTYTPNANFNGSDSVTFRVNDGQLDSNIAT
ncbi:MAG: Ig-like domain-containing protein, partial [Pseudomonadales bacterium]|nr:Ig-like domain-containing protein [Pseudomonadales bacterium]